MTFARRPLGHKLGASLVGVSAAFALHPGLAAAQSSPSQTPPGPDAASTGEVEPFAFPQAQGTAAPPGAESARFVLRGVTIDGGFEELRPKSEAIIAPYLGREITVAEFYVVAQAVQNAYFEAGYPLVRVVVPPQEVEAEGEPRLLVIDGFIESIDVSQAPRAVRARINRVLQRLVGAVRPTSALIERKLLIAGDTAGLELRTILTPGTRTGAAVLVLTGEHSEVDLALSADNRVPDELGGYQATASIALNSVLGGGEQIYLTYAGHPDSNIFSEESRRRYLVFGMTAPFGDDGLTGSLAAEYSSTRPEGDLAPLMLGSEYYRVGASFSWPAVQSVRHTVVPYVSFDATSEFQSTHIVDPAVTLSADRTRVLRVGVQGSSAFSTNRIAYGAELSRGLTAFGARTAADATILKPLSRLGADADFTKLEARLDLTINAGPNAAIRASVRAQSALGNPLLRSEQFSPLDDRGVSGPPPGAMVGDSGVAVRLEYEHAIDLSHGMSAAPYVFVSDAQVSLEQPSVLESAETNMNEVGVGLRFALPTSDDARTGATLALEWSSVRSHDQTLNGDWFNFRIVTRF